MSQEIVTLQFGNYSNYVGAHYWNMHNQRMLETQGCDGDDQFEYKNKLFRETCSSNEKKRFFPRAICFDIKTKLKSLKQDGGFTVYNSAEETNNINCHDVYDENCVLYTEDPIEKNEFIKKVINSQDFHQESADVNYDFDEKVSSWSDYLTYEFSDRSIQLLHETYSDGEDFRYFGMGSREYKSLLDDFEDNLHFWVEECDHMEGFQVFFIIIYNSIPRIHLFNAAISSVINERTFDLRI